MFVEFISLHSAKKLAEKKISATSDSDQSTDVACIARVNCIPEDIRRLIGSAGIRKLRCARENGESNKIRLGNGAINLEIACVERFRRKVESAGGDSSIITRNFPFVHVGGPKSPDINLGDRFLDLLKTDLEVGTYERCDLCCREAIVRKHDVIWSTT